MEVLSFGKLNKSSGPDFLEAAVRFENKIWAGHIEFHVKSSDWLKHGHQHDEAYNNVIAHFVFQHDQEIYSGNYLLPVVELKDQIISKAFNIQETPKKNNGVPCGSFIQSIDKQIINRQVKTAIDQRTKRKRDEVVELFRSNTNNQKRVMLILIARVLGGKYNSHAMERLVSKINFSTLSQLNGSFEQLKSYILGLSGIEMDTNFKYIQKLYQLRSMSKVEWRTSGMRPPSQPINRILQLTAILYHYDSIDITANVNQWRDFFKWKQLKNANTLSDGFVDLILINAVVPFLNAMSWFKADEVLAQNATSILKNLKPEKNQIVKGWAKLGFVAQNAEDSQGLIELKNNYCNEKKCLICGIGKNVLGQ